MTGEEFRKIRESLGFSYFVWGLALGYRGNRSTIHRTIKRYENGEREISPVLARLVMMYNWFDVPEELF